MAIKSHAVNRDPSPPSPLPTDTPQPPAQQQAAEWFVRLRAADCDALTRAQFEAWLQAHPDHRREYAAVAALWEELEGLRPALRPPPRARRWHWPAAAALLLAAGLGGYAYTRAEIYRTATGEARVVSLADGTVAHLNTASEIAVSLAPQLRTVTLRRGEALFEVAPDPARPFLVKTGDLAIRDIGTRFAVEQRDHATRITVTAGAVEIRPAGADLPACRVAAGEAVTVAGGSCGALGRADPARDLAWLEGRLIFDRTPLREVAATVNRYHTPPLRLAPDGVGELAVSGAFRIDHLQRLPQLLARSLPVVAETADDGGWLLRRAGP